MCHLRESVGGPSLRRFKPFFGRKESKCHVEGTRMIGGRVPEKELRLPRRRIDRLCRTSERACKVVVNVLSHKA